MSACSPTEPTDVSSETADVASETADIPDGAIVVDMGGDGGLVYTPQDISVSVGDTVTWFNKTGFHNVIFDSVPDGVDAEAISVKALAREIGPSHSVTFEVPGTYGYYCSPHKSKGMIGTVTVS
ncbi:MAG: plastocyanin [Cyanobacteria bacterium P01_F01_bin.42]